MNHYVYEITNLINGKKYIGKRSCHCPIEEDSYMGSGTLLKRAIDKYSIENFKKEILQVCNSEDEAYELETKYIENVKAYSDRKYYNIACGGKGFKSEHVTRINIERWKNAEYKEKVSNSIKTAWSNPIVKEKISNSIKSSWTEERKQNAIKSGNYSHPHNDETKKLLSEMQKGRIWVNNGTEEKFVKDTSKYLSNGWQLGKLPISDDTRRKMSESAKNRKCNTVGKKKIHKGDIGKFVSIEELQKYLDDGWELGVSEKRKEFLRNINKK